MPKANILDKARVYLMRYAPKGRDAVETQMIARSPSHVRRAATNFLDYDTREPVRMRDVEVLGEVQGPHTRAQKETLDYLSRKWAPAADLHKWEVRFDDGSYTYVNAFSQKEVLEKLNPLRTGKRIVNIIPTTMLL